MSKVKEIKLRIISAGEQAVEQLIKVAKEDIIKPNDEDELSADRLKTLLPPRSSPSLMRLRFLTALS